MPPHPLVIPCPRETVGSGRDSRQNRQSIHPSAWLEWSITKFLGPACCYRRNQQDGARGALLSPDRSRFCVCARTHTCLCVLWARVRVCTCELMRVNVKQMLTKVTQFDVELQLCVSLSAPKKYNSTNHWTLAGAFISPRYLFTLRVGVCVCNRGL